MVVSGSLPSECLFLDAYSRQIDRSNIVSLSRDECRSNGGMAGSKMVRRRRGRGRRGGKADGELCGSRRVVVLGTCWRRRDGSVIVVSCCKGSRFTTHLGFLLGVWQIRRWRWGFIRHEKNSG